MNDTVVSGLWLTIIDMTVVFIVLYVLALIIKAIKLVVAPFGGNGPNGGRGNGRRIPEPGAGEPETVGAAETESPGAPESINAETTAVIAAALAAYLEQPATAPVIVRGVATREESHWAMAGRTRIMQSRELVKRRATA